MPSEEQVDFESDWAVLRPHRRQTASSTCAIVNEGHLRFVVTEMLGYVVAQSTCKREHVITGYGETASEAIAQLLEEFNARRKACESCGILGLFGG